MNGNAVIVAVLCLLLRWSWTRRWWLVEADKSEYAAEATAEH